MSTTHQPHETEGHTPSLSERATRIIMTDDDQNDHLLMVMAVDAAGIDVDLQFADDGSDLLIRLASIEDVADLPDLLILDLRMPGIDGHRTLAFLEEHPVLWQLPVVVFTSSTRLADEVLSYERGARWVEQKPSEFEELVAFARSLPDRAGQAPRDETWAETGDALNGCLASLRADTFADVEDEMLFRPGSVGSVA